MSRWMKMMVRADWLKEAAAGSQAGVDLLTKGVVFLDDAGRVLHANPAAVRLLGDRMGRVNLGLSGSGDGSAVDAHARAVSLTRRPHSLTISRRGQPLTLALSPLPRMAGRGTHALGKLVGSVGGGDGFHHRASVVLTVSEPAGLNREALAGLARQWGPAPAEEALLRAVGTSPTEHAERRGVKISTVRSQVRAVLEKSGQKIVASLLLSL